MENDLPFEEAFELVELEPLQKAIVKQRYLPLLKGLRRQTFRLALFFHSKLWFSNTRSEDILGDLGDFSYGDNQQWINDSVQDGQALFSSSHGARATGF